MQSMLGPRSKKPTSNIDIPEEAEKSTEVNLGREDGVPNDGVPQDGVPHDGVPNDGVPHLED